MCGVAREVVEQVAEVDVGALAERDEVREADARATSPSRASPSPARPTARRRRSRRAAHRCARSSRSGRCRGVSRPRQLGPSRRSRCGRAASSAACFCAARQAGGHARWRRACRARRARRPAPAPCAGGVQITARSGACGQVGRRARTTRHAVERRVLRVDRVDRPGEAAGAQVAPDRRADAAGAVAMRRTRRPSAARAAGRDCGCSCQGCIQRAAPSSKIARRCPMGCNSSQSIVSTLAVMTAKYSRSPRAAAAAAALSGAPGGSGAR